MDRTPHQIENITLTIIGLLYLAFLSWAAPQHMPPLGALAYRCATLATGALLALAPVLSAAATLVLATHALVVRRPLTPEPQPARARLHVLPR